MSFWQRFFHGGFSLVIFLLSIIYFVYKGVLGGLTSSYHPHSDVAHYLPYFLGSGLAMVVAFGFVATRHLVKARQISPLRFVAELGICFLIWPALFEAAKLVVPAPDLIVLNFNNEGYAIPRHYAPQVAYRSDVDPPEELGLSLTICFQTGRAFYSGRCKHVKGTPRQVALRLSHRPITSNWYVRRTLERMSNITFEGETIGPIREKYWMKIDPRQGLHGYKLHQREFYTDENARLQVWRECRWNWCTVIANREQGHVRLDTENVPFDLQAIRKRQREVEALLEGWRCASINCQEVDPDRIVRPRQH